MAGVAGQDARRVHKEKEAAGIGERGRKGAVICGWGTAQRQFNELYVHVEFPTASAFHESERIRFEPKDVAFYSQTG